LQAGYTLKSFMMVYLGFKKRKCGLFNIRY